MSHPPRASGPAEYALRTGLVLLSLLLPSCAPSWQGPVDRDASVSPSSEQPDGSTPKQSARRDGSVEGNDDQGDAQIPVKAVPDASARPNDMADAGPGAVPPTAAGSDIPASNPACVGNAGKSVCSGAMMLACDATGAATHMVACETAALCELGVAKGTCATCTPGKFHCTDATLEKCSTDGQKFEPTSPVCSSAALCNEQAGACTKEACLADSKTCSGDVLQKCNDAHTAFVEDTRCGPGLCDLVGKQCDVCKAGSKTCEDNQVSTCNADGQATTATACPSGKPLCTGKGNCVQCVHTSDCPDAPECTVAACNTASGTCGTTFTAPRTPCSGGICDGKGNCGAAPKCGDGVVNQANEKCDDGNSVDTDDCLSSCKVAFCGDGVVHSRGAGGEDCEPGVGDATVWNCSSDCHAKTAYKPCRSNNECSTGEVCSLGFCTTGCMPLNGWGDGSHCPEPPAPLVAWCNAGVGICQLTECRTAFDCPTGFTCRSTSDFTGVMFKTLCVVP